MKKEVGYRIRKLRESKDLSQQNMADEMNIQISTYSKIERGITDPSIGRLKQIADILKVRIEQLILEQPVEVKQEQKASYSFASKEELNELATMMDKLRVEIANVKKEIQNLQPNKKTTKNK